MLSGDIKTQDITGSTNDNLCDSLALNFESNRVVVGTRRNNASGQIKIYNYDPSDSGTGTANTWVLAQTITGSSSSTNFGQSTDMNYDGNRIVVGAPGENKVYVYDATSTSTNEWATYVSNTITGTSSSNFGFSVSLAKDISTKLAIGSPSENKVYMYELSGSTWSQTWSNVATDVPNLVPLTTTTDVCMTSNNASYGYSIDLAPFGRFLAIGAPGVLTTISSSNSTYTGGTTFRDIYYNIEGIVYGVTGTNTGNIYQRGYIRCFTTSNVVSTWQNTTGGTGITSLEEVTQHGQLVYGSSVSNLNNFTGENSSQSWSLPALGFSVAISVDGSKLVGGEPFYSPPGNQASIHRGNVRAWLYDNTRPSDKFQEINSSAATWFGDKFGYAVKLDYDGGRLAVGSTKRWSGGSVNEGEDHGGVHVFDFTSTAFYEVNQGNNDFDNSEVSHAAIAISNGTTVAFGAKQYTSSTGGKVRFYHLILSQVILGNTVIGGHIAADSIFIGPNNDLEDNSFRKRISFGGTYKDNKYDATEIENRSFSTDISHEGHSELLMVKKSIGAGGTGGRDMIRLKANEIQLHNYITRGHSTDDNKYDISPRLTMSEEGNFKLNPEFLYGKYDSSTHSSCDVKALLDINGDTFCRGKLNAGHKDRSNTKGFDREQSIIFYDTRDRDIIDGTSVTSHVMTELQRENNPGTISNSVTYNDTESAFKLGTNASRIYNDKGGYKHNHEGLKYSCWIKLTKDHDQYSSSGETILSAGNFSGHYSKCQIYSGGVQILYNSGYKLQKSVTFIKDRWYHLFFYLNARQNTPSTSNNYLWIDGASQGLTGNTSGGSASAPSSGTDNFYVGSTNDSIVDAYIGMIHARNTNNNTSYALNPTELYTNGSPSERLSVGGDAFIEQKLGIANVVPMYPLDVTGDINFTGTLRQNNSNLICLGSSSSAGAPLQVLASKFTSNTSPTNNGILLKQEGFSSTNHAIMAIEVANANSGDPFVSWNTNETGGGWSMGIDNSDSDILKIANSKDSLGTDTHMEFSSSGTDFKKAILANGSAGTNGQVLTSTGGGTVSWTTVSGGGGGSSLSGTNTFEWGTGVSGKETNAGKIGYSTFTSGSNGALDIVGAGTSSSNRNVRIYDNIGIGTGSPTSPLHVIGDAFFDGGNIYFNKTSGSVSKITSSSTGNDLRFYSDHWIRFIESDTNAEKLVINGNGGKIGINHSTPDSCLHIASSSGQTITLDGTTRTSYIHYVRGTGHWYAVVDNDSGPNHNMYWYSNTSQSGNPIKQIFRFENDTAGAGSNAIDTFTGQHMSSIVDVTPTNVSNCVGLIVSSNQNDYMTINGGTPLKGAKNIHVNEAIPVVKISTKVQDKACFGVISSGEDSNESGREQRTGRIVGVFHKESGDNRVYINSIGEGGVWVVNTNGNLEAGDYITTSNVSGYGMKQTSEFLANYTVAKITMDCNFNPGQVPVKQIKKVSATNTYYVRSTDNDTCNETFYNTLDDETKALYTRDVRTEMVNDLDSNGVFQWEDTSETELAYNIRYLDADGIETTQENAVHIAAFVGCTYHCG